ncbi:PTS glucose transporter subunit IIA [Buchnera aphidicola (Taiwanaphis decaspermi)]|uniref:PTS glucose transporter subunit IIA n=1 Tax=Buchnera aphidicola TaxID=9 RepID=UPI0031B82DAD
MGLFSKLFGNKRQKKTKVIKIISPLSGTIIEIEKVPDKVFSDKIVGDGIAIIPRGKRIVSPCDGKIGKIFNTNHAFSIKSTEGVEIFVHFGIDTVKLNGLGFNRIAKEGQNVKQGDLIIEYDLKILSKKAKSIITPVIISNIEKIKKIKKSEGKTISGKSIIMYLEK